MLFFTYKHWSLENLKYGKKIIYIYYVFLMCESFGYMDF